MKQNEVLPEHNTIELTLDDQSWLYSFGVDPSWQDDPTLAVELNELIRMGSERINESYDESQHQQIILAREKFFGFVGIDAETLRAFRQVNPTIIPLDTFISTQRVMHNLGLDAVKIINTQPSAIGLAPESVRAKVDNFTALGLDAVKIINTLPSVIGLAPESVRAKVDNFTALGLDAVKIINTLPSAIGYAPESVRAKVNNFTALGLDAVKIINTLPSAIGYAPESVRAKVDNFTALGLDAVKIINTQPVALSYAPESVRAKLRLLELSTKVLQWEFTAKELIEEFPVILGFSTKKLQILRRIAATHLTDDARSIQPKSLKSKLVIPLEKYLLSIQLDEQSPLDDGLLTNAGRIKLNARERKAEAMILARTDKLGRIGIMYLDYAK